MSSYYIILLLLNHSFFCTYSMTIYCRSIVHVILLFEIDHWTVSVTFLAKEEPSHCNPAVRHQHQRVNGKRPHFLFRRFVLWGGVRVVGSIPLCAVTFRCNGTFIWSSTFCCDWNRIVPVRPHTGGRGLKKRVSFSCTVMTKKKNSNTMWLYVHSLVAMAFFGIGIHVSPVLHGSSVKNTECCAPMSDINLSTISLIGAAFGRKVVASIADGIGINISVILIIGRTDSCRKRRQGYHRVRQLAWYRF